MGNMVWNCIKLICFSVLVSSCSNHRNVNYADNLPVNEIISNWENSIQEKGEPKYLGGMYVENGFVCFYVTSDTYKTRSDIFERCKSSNGIIVRMCGNSKEFLMQQIKLLDSLMFTDNFTDLKHYGHYLDDRKNRIVVLLGDTSANNINLFKERVMNSSALVFEKSRP